MKYIKLFEEMTQHEREMERDVKTEELKTLEPWLKSLGYHYELLSGDPSLVVKTEFGEWILRHKRTYSQSDSFKGKDCWVIMYPGVASSTKTEETSGITDFKNILEKVKRVNDIFTKILTFMSIVSSDKIDTEHSTLSWGGKVEENKWTVHLRPRPFAPLIGKPLEIIHTDDLSFFNGINPDAKKSGPGITIWYNNERVGGVAQRVNYGVKNDRVFLELAKMMTDNEKILEIARDNADMKFGTTLEILRKKYRGLASSKNVMS